MTHTYVYSINEGGDWRPGDWALVEGAAGCRSTGRSGTSRGKGVGRVPLGMNHRTPKAGLDQKLIPDKQAVKMVYK